MDRITCFIVDDEKPARDIVKIIIERSFSDILICSGEASTLEEAIEGINRVQPDLVFLDIELGKDSGFDLYQHFPEPDFSVIFTTGHQSYAIKAIRYAALDYLLKPISVGDMKESIQRIQDNQNKIGSNIRYSTLFGNLKKNYPTTISLASYDGFESVEIDDIMYIKADVNYSNVMIINGKSFFVAKTLKKYEDLLPPDQFFRAHKSYIVNRLHIKYFDEKKCNLFMHDGYQIEIATRRKKEVTNLLKN